MNRGLMLKLSRKDDYKPKEVLEPEERNVGDELTNDVIYSAIPRVEKVASALGPRQRSYVLDYLSNFLYYANHGEKLK